MDKRWIKVTLLLLLVAAVVVARVLLADYLTFHHLKQHKEHLLTFIRGHYAESVAIFMAFYVGTALCLPGALVLTVIGGMMFGTWQTMLYVNVGATTGAVCAFLVARFLVGEWIQRTFRERMKKINEELSRHGKNYLLVLRLVPIAPFFLINYCAGLTMIPLWTFVWTTSVGMIPGSFVYAFLGHQLRNVNEPAEVLSWKTLLALLLLAFFALLPVLGHHLKAAR